MKSSSVEANILEIYPIFSVILPERVLVSINYFICRHFVSEKRKADVIDFLFSIVSCNTEIILTLKRIDFI